ncbi:MAG: twin-arginine translocase TatA/TatE family subunit [Myxococcales bacterium]|nr:twin-arginine translocase TatA/TatE family subunit [Myxococcales bacterium]
MFNIGVTEILLILGVALLVLGPNKLPEVARMVGRGLREFRRTARELEEELDPIRETLQPEYYGDLGLDEQDLADADAHENELLAGDESERDEDDEGEAGDEDHVGDGPDDSTEETVSIRPPDGSPQPFRADADPTSVDPIAEWDIPEGWEVSSAPSTVNDQTSGSGTKSPADAEKQRDPASKKA